MLNIIHEAGFFGPLSLIITAAGMAATIIVARKGRSAMATSVCFALTLAAFGTLAYAMGQHLVHEAVSARMMQLDTRELVELLSLGTREASRNLLLGGGGALLVLLTGGGAKLAVGRGA